MRLIDADELKKELYQDWFLDILLTQQSKENMFRALAQKVDSQPTSYDLDNVVSQMYKLKKYDNKYDEYYDNIMYRIKEFENDKVNSAIGKAIEIVKRGGLIELSEHRQGKSH